MAGATVFPVFFLSSVTIDATVGFNTISQKGTVPTQASASGKGLLLGPGLRAVARASSRHIRPARGQNAAPS